MAPFVLIVEDEEAIAWALRKACERLGCRVVVCPEAESALNHAERSAPAAILLDIRLPGMDGLTALVKFKAIAPHAAVVVMTAHGNLDTAVKAVEGGAYDYLAKPFDLDQAIAVIRRATAERSTDGIAPKLELGDVILGNSAPMQQVFKRIAMVAATDASVLVTGESGTGKELVARAIHTNSPRRAKPFLPLNLAAMEPANLESELFGRADEPSRAGLFVLADGGTLFLDELGDVPLGVQAKLTRVLERREVVPVGATNATAVDVRIVAAALANLEDAVAAGTFRRDLFFRINVFPISVPTLAERLGDLPLLAAHFLAAVQPRPSAIPAETIAFLQRRAWPGHVRELKNAVEHAAILARGGPLLPEHFPPAAAIAGECASKDRLAEAVRRCVREAFAETRHEPSDLHTELIGHVESALIDEVMARVKGNRLAAGRALGLARATVRKLIRRAGLDDVADE